MTGIIGFKLLRPSTLSSAGCIVFPENLAVLRSEVNGSAALSPAASEGGADQADRALPERRRASVERPTP